jgi:hypothetical protein
MKKRPQVLLLSTVMFFSAVCSFAQPTPRKNMPSPYSHRTYQEKTDTTNKRSLYDRYMDSQEKRGRHIERVNREDLKATFIPKGQWMAGGSIAFNEWDGDNLNYLVLKNIEFEGHTFSASPYVAYFFKNNLAFGGRFSYSRNYLYLGKFDLNLGEDFNISLDNLYYLEHKHEGSIFMRNYMPLFGSKIFGAFAEVRATYSRANGKNSTGVYSDDPLVNSLDGTYETVHKVQLGISPGLCIFVTDFAAVETSIGVLGVDYKWSNYKNIHPNSTEYEYGKSHSGGANFRFNIFSIHIGMTFYL